MSNPQTTKNIIDGIWRGLMALLLIAIGIFVSPWIGLVGPQKASFLPEWVYVIDGGQRMGIACSNHLPITINTPNRSEAVIRCEGP